MTSTVRTVACGCILADPGHRCESDRLGSELGYAARHGVLPPDLADLPVGQRVAAIRKLRSLTQAGLAARLHRSESWVTKIERGERQLDSIKVLRDLARVLAVPLSHLTQHDDVGLSGTRPGRDVDLAGLRRVLSRSPAIASLADGRQVTVRELAREVAALRRRYHRAPHNITTLFADGLAGLVSQAQAGLTVLGGLHSYAGFVAGHAGELAETRRLLRTANGIAGCLQRDRGARCLLRTGQPCGHGARSAARQRPCRGRGPGSGAVPQ